MSPESLAFAPKAFCPPSSRPPVCVRWLGTAGFEITHGPYTLLIDPYVTRAPLSVCVTGPLKSDDNAVRVFAPQADAIVVGHCHFDHALDVPAIARATGALVFGSRSTARLCHAFGIPSKLVSNVEDQPSEYDVGPFRLRFFRSRHSKLLFGRAVLADGDLGETIPQNALAYRSGTVLAVEIEVAGLTLFHLGSAEIDDASIPSRAVDLLLFCAEGWTLGDRVPERVLHRLSPKAILLSHWDNFFMPFDRGPKPLPGLALARLVERFTRLRRDLLLGTLPFFGDVRL